MGENVFDVGIVTDNLMADGAQKMGFTQTGTAVNKQRVVGTARIGRYRLRRGVRELVG
ncbi:hypothetical protein SDC9_162077 [bioreactor metagenome]|uniref:Uncharacterized protein n=1 Tax=bioreactor metagenome TaxID=1076179 RepID=A0A645FK26_9ZZZZ